MNESIVFPQIACGQFIKFNKDSSLLVSNGLFLYDPTNMTNGATLQHKIAEVVAEQGKNNNLITEVVQIRKFTNSHSLTKRKYLILFNFVKLFLVFIDFYKFSYFFNSVQLSC